MTQIHKSLVCRSLLGIVFLFPSIFFSQTDGKAVERLDAFMKESCETRYREVAPDSVGMVLQHKVYHITQQAKNLYGKKTSDVNRFIVIDNGETVNSFERINGDTELPKFKSYIREDFRLNDKTAAHFQGVLDLTYPIPSWKPDKREFFFTNDKWYFLRDAYFRTKQGFEVSVDTEGKIVAICYKMKWDEPESK